MEFTARLIIVLIFIGLFALMYIIGGILEALYAYIKHTKEKRAKERRHNSPMANKCKGAKYER